MKYILRNQNRRPRDTSPHVSLFPFLAVLICTMGALVPLLFTISRQARLQAKQAAAAKDEATKADAKSEREMAQWRIEQIRVSRKKTEADIETARLELGHLEDHSRRLKSKIAELEKTIGEIDRSGGVDGEKRVATSAELEELRKQITEAEKQLADAKIRTAGKKRSFAVIPYEGPNSTHRRPIYLECREDAVVLQPEGIEFRVRDFEGPMGPSNPLAAALRAEREYLLSRNGFDPRRDGEPYPLLLVRPDGIVAYYAARAAMKSWGPEFGYEFVEADWKLAYQPPDPQLARALNDAVASARVVQERLIAAAPRQYSLSSPSSLSRGSSSRGGEGGDSASGAPGTTGGSARGGGGAGSRGGYGIGFGGGGGDGRERGGDDFDSWDNNRPKPGAPDPFLAGINNPYASLAIGGSGTGGSGQGTASGYGGGIGTGAGGARQSSGSAIGGGVGTGNSGSGQGSGQDYGTGISTGGGGVGQGSGPGYGGGVAMGTGGSGQGSQPGYGGGIGTGIGGSGQGSQPGYGGGIGTGTGGSGQGSQPGYGGGGSTEAGGAGPILGNANGAGIAGSGGVGGSSVNANGVAGGGNTSGGGQGPAQGMIQGHAPAAGQATVQGQGGATGPAKRSAEPPDIFASRVAASNAAKHAGEKQLPPDSADARGGMIAAPLHPGEWHEKPEPPPEPVVQFKAGRNGSKPKYREQDWGLKETARGSVPITRPVVIECQADRLLLLPERGRGGNPVAVMASGTDSTIDDLVSAIWDRMGQWGMAGRGMYWRPVLHVRVAPGGEQRFSDLQVLLEGSGLNVMRQ